jgi:uncharacterized membrane protein YhhN
MNPRLVAFAASAAVAYLALVLADTGSPIVIAIKPVAALALAVGAWRGGGRWLAAALLAHAVGDVAIELGGILAGIGPFLLGHLLYLAALWPLLPTPEQRRAHDPFLRKLLVAVLAGWAAFLISLLLRHLDGALATAVPIYGAALLALAATTTLARVDRWTVLGAVLFVASDSILAIDAFVAPIPWRDLGVWPTYAAAQVLLAVGILRAGKSSG